MITEEQSRQETDRVLRLMRKFNPREAQPLPEGDVYVLPSSQTAVWATLWAAVLVPSLWLAVLWGISLGGGSELATAVTIIGLGLGLLLTVVMVHPVLVEWRLRLIRPIYASRRLGQVWVGQRAEPWMLRGGGSSPDTVHLERQEISTPQTSWASRTFFKDDQLVEIPSGQVILMREGLSDLYRIRDYWLGKRNQGNEATIESNERLEAIRRLLAERLGELSVETIRQVVREELQKALARLPKQVVAEFAKSFDVGVAESDTS